MTMIVKSKNPETMVLHAGPENHLCGCGKRRSKPTIRSGTAQ